MNNFFSGIFEPELIEQINQLEEADIEKGEIILKEKSYINVIPLVIEGNIKVRKTDEKGKEIILYHIISGESCILSITSCLNDKQSNAEAITEEKTKLIVVPATLVKEWMDKYKSWRKFVVNLYYNRLDGLLSLVDSISFKQTDTRLIEKLKELQKEHGEIIPITHQSLANEIGTAREVISRLLKTLEKEGMITLERGTIQILKPL